MSLRQTIRHHLGYILFIAVLLLCSGFFTYKVEVFRAATSKARLDDALAPGAQVRLVRVIDGDEIMVAAAADEAFVVRLLGIKSFDAVANDPGISTYGRQCMAFLQEHLEDQPATLQFDDLARDSRGRLLAYVHANGTDLGKEMVARGLALPFLRYDFSREAEYRRAQVQASEARLGLWGAARADRRARALLLSWEAMRAE